MHRLGYIFGKLLDAIERFFSTETLCSRQTCFQAEKMPPKYVARDSFDFLKIFFKKSNKKLAILARMYYCHLGIKLDKIGF
jgi:hypothetical protein